MNVGAEQCWATWHARTFFAKSCGFSSALHQTRAQAAE
jgi:hypothetical protein